MSEEVHRKRPVETDENDSSDNKRMKLDESDSKEDTAAEKGAESQSLKTLEDDPPNDQSALPETKSCESEKKIEVCSEVSGSVTNESRAEETNMKDKVEKDAEETDVNEGKKDVEREKAMEVNEESPDVKNEPPKEKPANDLLSNEKTATSADDKVRSPEDSSSVKEKLASEIKPEVKIEATEEKEEPRSSSLIVHTNELNETKELPKSDSEDQVDEKSEGSEKENIDHAKDKVQSPDVIMLSDEEDMPKGKDNLMSTPQARRLRIMKKIKFLQNQLRNEEATLVLLKKLRQSQITQPPEPVQQTPPPRPTSHHPQLNQQHMRQHSGPPPLVRGSQPSSKTLHSTSQNSHMRSQQMTNQSSRSQQGPPPLVMAPRTGNGQGVQSQQQSHGSRNNIPPNYARGNDNRNQQRIQQQPLPPQQPPQVTSKQTPLPQAPPQDTQTPAQRQAAAKQALRKQLEKTLLQIPPPKPPPPEMNFIPSLACPDFILLLGLEEVVNHMIDFQLIARGQKNPDERFVCTPFTCVQCGSDFTPVWKREKPGSKNVICEHCVTTNQKKALKQEHTNRLKSAFVKALQQEQEIERMQASSAPSPQPSVSNTPQPQHPSAPMISAASAAAAAANAAAAAAVANFRPSAEQLRQHHFLQQAQLRAGQPLGLQAFSRAPFPYNLPFAKQQDLQRQYLLDMIPRGSMPWKQ